MTPGRKSKKGAPQPVSPPPKSTYSALPIVGIGASAGGLEAFEAFFRACPVDTGMAFVLVPHLDPGHVSLLTEILQRSTAMPVHEALDQIAVEADHVYIIPPNREMAILGGVLQLSVPEQARGQRMPVDGFLRSLADDQREHAIGIVLSGTATDGTLGLRAIHGAGGVCMVQEPSTAKYDGMPQSAINAGYATHILPVERMPAMLLEALRLSAIRLRVPAVLPEKTLSGINQILLQVRSATGHDFSLYKKSTIGRRIERRMAQHCIEEPAVYARYLKENPAEIQLLFKELLINVTSFFRDPEAFVALKQNILPALLTGKPPGYTFRVWVAGCASGEEAYSIAILLHELLDEVNENSQDSFTHDITLQIYATDLDDDAIATARSGTYPPNIAQDVTPERLRRFFTKDETGGYKVKKNLRESVVFAVQNVVKDPPFTKLDLLRCRNLMIYLEPELQNRLIPNFHYALKPDGVLFLSTSESITNQSELFTALDRKWKFYRAIHGNPANIRSQTMTGDSAHLSAAPLVSTQSAAIAAGPESAMGATAPAKKSDNIADLSNRALLQSYAPAAVTIDARGDILFVHGDTGRYLRPAPGPLSNNVVDMAREGLQQPLRAALLGAAAEAEPQRSGEVSVKTNGGFSLVRFSLRRLPGQHGTSKGGAPLLLVCFEDVAGAAPAPAAKKRPGRASTQLAQSNEHDRIAFLENELAYNKENLQATIEEAQAANEELKSTNEELQSTNEELQSSNEELETSKEELQSLNEETITVNGELNARIEQLSSLQNDMKNLFDNINVGTLFIDHNLVIRRYTREAVKIYRLIAGDVGRPLGDIKSNIVGDDLLAEIQRVLDTLIPVERELQTLDGKWYVARIHPYRTLDNVIEGVVLTFADISERREAERLKLGVVQLARELAEGIVNTVSELLVVLDGQLQVVSASRSFYTYFQVKAEETVGRRIYDLGNGQWRIPALRKLLEDILPHDQVIEGYVVEHDFPGLGQLRMQLNARRIVTAIGNTELILFAMLEEQAPRTK